MAESNSPNRSALYQMMGKDAFSRMDESDDSTFYAKERFVSHLDPVALATVEKVIDDLVIEESPVIMDLMASWDSHLPSRLRSSRIIGLGLNENEMRHNSILSEYVLHDLNRDPGLPFPQHTFDVVINTVSIDYMTRPVDVFIEVGRILKPGGLFLVLFSNRMFPEKAVNIWRRSSEEERVLLVEDFFREAAVFGKTTFFVSKGKPRPEDDKYAPYGIPSDPIYAVYAERQGGSLSRKARPSINLVYGKTLSEKELQERKGRIKDTLQCPYCGEKLRKWAVPENPFEVTWDNEFMYICFNDRCPYYVRGWDCMSKEGNQGVSYRLMYNPEKDVCMPIPVPSPVALRESIVDEK
jgi:SAM-dependent methyltransferase